MIIIFVVLNEVFPEWKNSKKKPAQLDKAN